MRQYDPLSETELDALLGMSSDDCDMSAVEAAVQEVRALRAEKHELRNCLLHTVQEKQVLEGIIARQSACILELRRKAGLAPHDWEPARPGIEDVD